MNRNHNLGINKLGKPIKKESQPTSIPPPQHSQVYNISKNDFRSFVQQLTGAGSTVAPRPQSSQRLQQIRPPPLSSVTPPAPMPVPARFPAESPVTAYMKYLENSLLYSDGSFAAPATASSSVPAPVSITVRSPFPILSPGFQPLSPLSTLPMSPLGFLMSPAWRNDK